MVEPRASCIRAAHRTARRGKTDTRVLDVATGPGTVAVQAPTPAAKAATWVQVEHVIRRGGCAGGGLQQRQARFANYNRHRMISKDEVLHVAKLARLRLSADELDRMAAELSQILDHVEKISELDLDGVEPTSHVIELENVLREDLPRPCLSREVALSQAPDATPDGFRVPTAGA